MASSSQTLSLPPEGKFLRIWITNHWDGGFFHGPFLFSSAAGRQGPTRLRHVARGRWSARVAALFWRQQGILFVIRSGLAVVPYTSGQNYSSWCPIDSVQLVYISNFTRTYGRYIELVDGVINQLITGGYHIVPGSSYGIPLKHCK